MDEQQEGLDRLKIIKKRFIRIFYVLLIANPALRVAEMNGLGALGAILGLVLLGLAIWFVVMTYQFARALGYGVGSTIGLVLISFLPLINLIIVLMMIKKYREITGATTNFFLNDVPAPSA